MTDPSFVELAAAASGPRWRTDRRRRRSAPQERESWRELADQYESVLDPAPPDPLVDAPIAVTPTQYRTNLGCAKARLDAWEAIVDPAARDVYLVGRRCRGIAHKVLDDPLAPSLIIQNDPPAGGVSRPQWVRAVAAAKALAWERETPVDRAFVEYPALGVIRRVRLTTRRTAAVERLVRRVRARAGPPLPLADRSVCEVRTSRTLCCSSVGGRCGASPRPSTHGHGACRLATGCLPACRCSQGSI